MPEVMSPRSSGASALNAAGLRSKWLACDRDCRQHMRCYILGTARLTLQLSHESTIVTSMQLPFKQMLTFSPHRLSS